MMTRERRRTAGDDWKWNYATTDDVSNWANPVIQLRDKATKDGTLLGSNVDVDEFTANIFTTANTDIDSPATNFSTGRLAFYMLADETASITSPPYLEIQAEVDGAIQTVMPARVVPFKPALVSA